LPEKIQFERWQVSCGLDHILKGEDKLIPIDDSSLTFAQAKANDDLYRKCRGGGQDYAQDKIKIN